MGVVTVSTSVARIPLGLSEGYLTRASLVKRTEVLSFKHDKNKKILLVSPQESVVLPLEANGDEGKRLRKVKKRVERVDAVSTDEAAPSTSDLDYNEAAAKLEYIYKRSPATVISVEEVKDKSAKRRRPRKRRTGEAEEGDKKIADYVVRSLRNEEKRLSLEKRIALKARKGEFLASSLERKLRNNDEDEKTDRLLREYSASGNSVRLDWKKTKIPPVLPSSEHAWLFKLMQPMKEILHLKETLQHDLGKELTDGELAGVAIMDAVQLRKKLAVGRAARNKLIKHNLRLVLFVMNKYFREFANGRPMFEDLCQAGVSGLIRAIDHFEPNRKSQLSTYGLFWIREAISRFMTRSSFMVVPFGLESVRLQINKAKQDLSFELQRLPTDKEIINRVRISPERYHDAMRVPKPMHSLHAVTQEEFMSGITDGDNIEGDKSRQPALLRLALDDVLDSLKPKESLVIRQRYGLDGRGDRTLGEIAGNLNISREMVRKYETKALMKLKHPTRVDYLRCSIFR